MMMQWRVQVASMQGRSSVHGHMNQMTACELHTLDWVGRGAEEHRRMEHASGRGGEAGQVKQLLDDGVNVGMGVDGSASNDAGNLLSEARLACFLQRHTGNVAGECRGGCGSVQRPHAEAPSFAPAVLN